MRLKLKSEQGVATINVKSDQLFNDFLTDVRSNTQISTDSSNVINSIKFGFPPKTIELDSSSTTTIQDKGIKDGDQLLIQFKSNKRKSSSTTSPPPTITNVLSAPKRQDTKDDIPSVFIESLNKYLILRNIPDDNSCMFNSISYAISGNDYSLISPPEELRKVIVNYIKKDPELYSDLVLGRSRDSYCEWILKKESWGGGIELGILSDWFDIQFTCIDIESGNFVEIKNEKKKPTKFIMLIYSGVHYDVLAVNNELSTKNKDKDECVWNISDSTSSDIIDAAKKLCKLLQEKDYSTNTTTFRVRCNDCYSVLVGETGVAKHAEQTGHLNFGEVKKKI
ncbi:OTU1 [Candida pseudojiufengensis]|uniref:OTU1 n=1 Tax=Candida pseudojiufengensis TaxID=497109 RepID=UPI002224750D|nr:OTU1 [Candida pseudojiufengensis]KAI5960283.1 OTU1 [Candida pseudojiufengensis]